LYLDEVKIGKDWYLFITTLVWIMDGKGKNWIEKSWLHNFKEHHHAILTHGKKVFNYHCNFVGNPKNQE